MDAKQTPLIELLDAVPGDARVIVEEEFASTAHPVGRLCHDAAAELRRLHEENSRLRQAIEHIVMQRNRTRQRVAAELDIAINRAAIRARGEDK